MYVEGPLCFKACSISLSEGGLAGEGRFSGKESDRDMVNLVFTRVRAFSILSGNPECKNANVQDFIIHERLLRTISA